MQFFSICMVRQNTNRLSTEKCQDIRLKYQEKVHSILCLNTYNKSLYANKLKLNLNRTDTI